MDPREEIKARLSIYDLVSEYVQLKKAGRNYKGLCPFHSEKSPSFMVSPEKEIAYCFGCHKGGDVFSFYELVEGVDFAEAINALAQKTGVELPSNTPAVSKQVASQKEVLYKLHDIAVDEYHNQLLTTDEGRKVYDYLLHRGLTDATIREFKIGFAPDDGSFLYKKLLSNGFDKEDLVASGLVLSRETDYKDLFDRFRLRLMFPITDKNGKTVGFGGRALKKDEAAKYLNSPETPIYHKSDVLFGFASAKDAIRQTSSVIIVEGYFDQLAVYQAGFKNVVAVSGTALTERHLSLISRYAKEIIFCLDMDKSGLQALYRGAEMALPLEFSLKVIDLHEFKDPAEAIQKDPEIFRNAKEKAKDFFDFFLEKEYYSRSESERSDFKFISIILELVLPIISKISSAIFKDIVIRKFAQTFGVKIDLMYDELQKYLSSRQRVNNALKKVPMKNDKVDFEVEDYFWAYLLANPALYKDVFDFVQKNESIFSEKQVYKLFLNYYNSGRDLTDLDLTDLDSDHFDREKYSILLLYIESVSSLDWSADEVKLELARIAKRLLTEYKKNEGLRLQRAIKEAEKSGENEKAKTLLADYNKVISL